MTGIDWSEIRGMVLGKEARWFARVLRHEPWIVHENEGPWRFVARRLAVTIDKDFPELLRLDRAGLCLCKCDVPLDALADFLDATPDSAWAEAAR